MNISTEDLRGALAILSKTDPQSYRSAKKLLSEFVAEIQKAKPHLELVSRTASYSNQKISARNTVDTCQAYLKAIAAIHSVSVNLPEEFKTPPGIRIMPEDRQPAKIPKTTTISKSVAVTKEKATNIQDTSCIIAGCCKPRISGSDFCQRHRYLSIRPVRESKESNKCTYPSCSAKRYAGSMYCQYHYQQEMYLSK